MRAPMVPYQEVRTSAPQQLQVWTTGPRLATTARKLGVEYS